MMEQYSETIGAQLAAHGRGPGDLSASLDGMSDWGRWLCERPGAFARKTVKLVRDDRDEDAASPTAQDIFSRVARTIKQADQGVTLVIAPTGGRKSTAMRKAAVTSVVERPDDAADDSVVVLVPRHELGAEQVRALHREHPNVDFTAAVWRGRHREDADFIGPQLPGKVKLMCWRGEEAKALEDVLVEVETHLCKRGRGAGAVRCEFYFLCGAQRQKQQRADVWFGAHELMAHPPPKAFGKIARVMIDESPLDAFLFGVDINDEMTLELGELLGTASARSFNGEYTLMAGREALHEALSRMKLPVNPHQGAPISLKDLTDLPSVPSRAAEGISSSPACAIALPTIQSYWRGLSGKTRSSRQSAPTCRQRKPRSRRRSRTAMRVSRSWSYCGPCWRTTSRAGCSFHNSDRGRIIRMVGMRQPAEGWGRYRP